MIVDEFESARLEARTQPSVKDMTYRVTALNGLDFSSFVVNAAYNAARSTIEAHAVTVIESEADREAFFDALDNPPAPNEQLKRAVALREELIANGD